MLIANSKMKEFISDIDLSSIELKNYYSVSKKENADREKYFIINKEIDCSLCSVSASGLELTLYEYKQQKIRRYFESFFKNILINKENIRR